MNRDELSQKLVNQSNKKQRKLYLTLWAIFTALPFALPNAGIILSESLLGMMNYFLSSAQKISLSAEVPENIQLYFSIVLIVSFFAGIWQFVFLIDKKSSLHFDFNCSGERNKYSFWFKSIFSLIFFLLLIWYIYQLPGGILLTNSGGRSQLLLSAALSNRLILGLVGGFLVAAISVVWVVIFLRAYYIIIFPFSYK